MRIISLIDGEMEFIKYDNELIKIVNKYMGYDMSCVIEELVEKTDEVKYKTESDLLSYELSLEESRDGYMELGDILESLSNLIKKKKINKHMLHDIIDKMENIINQHI